MKMKNAVIHWKINDKGRSIEGHGACMSTKDAYEWVKLLNERFGHGSHWVVEEAEYQPPQFVQDWE